MWLTLHVLLGGGVGEEEGSRSHGLLVGQTGREGGSREAGSEGGGVRVMGRGEGAMKCEGGGAVEYCSRLAGCS